MKKIILVILIFTFLSGQKLLIPMGQNQTNHLKAYGITYWVLKQGLRVEWLLNFRGGSFLIDKHAGIINELRLRGVSWEEPNASQLTSIYATIDESNMEVIFLEKDAKIAIYSPPNMQPWDDAVTLALTYAEVDYDIVWDPDVLEGKLSKYDWVHLHHEDFTGQYGKFYGNYRNQQWYQEQKLQFEAAAKTAGFASVSEHKKAIAKKIKNYIDSGGFLFAMCSATDALDIALAAENVDIVAEPFDGTAPDPQHAKKLNFSRTLAFKNFQLYTNPFVYEISDIDFPPSHIPKAPGAMKDYFSLFEFSAKYDPVPTMLTQNHVSIVKGFMGQTTGFLREKLKPSVVIMGEVINGKQVKYIHGISGKGSYTFLGGHDPEDYTHFVGDPKTELDLHRHSPGYRLILNNILFPSAKKKSRKT